LAEGVTRLLGVGEWRITPSAQSAYGLRESKLAKRSRFKIGAVPTLAGQLSSC
jgi:hypothetical protein